MVHGYPISTIKGVFNDKRVKDWLSPLLIHKQLIRLRPFPPSLLWRGQYDEQVKFLRLLGAKKGAAAAASGAGEGRGNPSEDSAVGPAKEGGVTDGRSANAKVCASRGME